MSSSTYLPSPRRICAVLALVIVLMIPDARALIPVDVQPFNPLLPRHFAPGSTVTIASYVSPGQTGLFQWFHDDAPLFAATQPTLTLTNVSSADSGNYRLRVTSGSTSEFSETATINVLPLPSSPVDPTFTSRLPNPPGISSVGSFASDGSMIVSGMTVDGVTPTARLASDGSIVAGFSFPATAGRVLAGFPDGSLITSSAPYRLNGDGSSGAFTMPAGFDSAQPLNAAAVQPDGKFLIAQRHLLKRLNADGSADTAFSYPGAEKTDITIQALRVDSGGRVYVTANRRNPIPTNYPFSWTVVFRLSSMGQRDASFREQTPDTLLAGLLQVLPLNDGRLLYYSAYHGYRVSKILLDDGRADPAWSGGSIFTEKPLVVNSTTNQVYVVNTQGRLLRHQITTTGMTEDTSFNPGNTSFANHPVLTLDPNGLILVAGTFTSWEGHATVGIARILPDHPTGPQPPNATITYQDSLVRGATIKLTAWVTGSGPFTYQWISLDGQALPPFSTNPELIIPSFSLADFGRYQLRLTGIGGTSVLSNVIELSYSSERPYLANLSGRAMTGSGENTVIAGLVTKIWAGSLGLPTLLRGVGPALQPLGVPNFLTNPAIDVINSRGELIANNDQWSVDPSTATAALSAGAFAFAPASNDAAMLQTFATGARTMLLRDQGQGDGIGLLEVYQLFPTGREHTYQSLMNLSLRARTAPGDAVTIAGFVIVDPQGFGRTARVLLRAIGPTLSSHGIVQPLANPVLNVYNNKGEIIAHNDDWAATGDASLIKATMTQLGAFDLPADSKDSVLLLDLPAGAYSMHANGGSGVVLLEIYIAR